MNDRDIVRSSALIRDKLVISWQITRGIHTDCLLNYETVKYFGGEAYEAERYASAINDYQSLEYRVIREWLLYSCSACSNGGLQSIPQSPQPGPELPDCTAFLGCH